MKRRFSWCTVVALLVLLFVTTEGLRGHNTQVEEHKTHDVINRGALRFNSKSTEEVSPSSTISSRSKSSRDRSQPRRSSNTQSHDEITTLRSLINSETKIESNARLYGRQTRTTEKSSPSSDSLNNSRRQSSGRHATESTKTEATISRRSDRTHLVENSERRKPKSSNRKITNSPPTEELSNKGPSVFTATTEYSRSRTGRKIQTSYTSKELKSQVPSSGRFASRRSDDVESTTLGFKKQEGRGRSGSDKITDKNVSKSNRSKSNVKEDGSSGTKGQDAVLSSESVRVDIPLAVGATDNPISTVFPSAVGATESTFTASSQRKTSRAINRRSEGKDSARSAARDKNSERGKNRGRSSDSEYAGSSSRNGSRRGASKFNDFATTEANEQAGNSRRNANSRDRLRNSETKQKNSVNESRSRSRGRNFEGGSKDNSAGALGQDVRRKSDRNSPERRSRVSETRSKPVDNRVQDQDTRGRSRNRSKIDTSTFAVPDIISTTQESTVSNDLIASTEPELLVTTMKSVSSPLTITTARPTLAPTTATTTRTPSTISTTETSSRNRSRGRGGNNQNRKSQKEDFFNHGLGFRGRKTSPEGSSPGESRRANSPKNETQSRGNPGWTLRRRPGFLNKPETTTKVAPPATKDQTNEIVPSNEQLTSTEVITTIGTSTSTVRRGSKKPQAGDGTTLAGTTAKSVRRGNKTFDKSGAVGSGKLSAEFTESDNYPPEFKARLTQLKNSNVKIPTPKSTARTTTEEQPRETFEENFGQRLRGSSNAIKSDDLEAAASGDVFPTDLTLITNPITSIKGGETRHVKKTSAALFAERSRMKLELARRLVKPELNIEDNDLEATTASSGFSKPRPTEIPVVEESKKVLKVSKVSKVTEASGRRGSMENSRGEENEKESKLSRLRKGLEDSSKVTTRSSLLKKGRIISERMVTSISIEESTKDIVESTTKPYDTSTSSSVAEFAEEASATTVDTTRIRLPDSRGTKKSKEETLTVRKSAKSSNSRNRGTDKDNSSNAAKPRKSQGYSPRTGKPNVESSTTVRTFSTSKPKKSSSSTRNYKNSAEQRKSKTSQEQETTKKTTPTSSATKTSFQPRYNKRPKQKNVEKEGDYETTIIPKTSVATSRYAKKKAEVKIPTDVTGQVTTTERTFTKKQEFRPRTATYRRHSEVPTTLIESSTKVDGAGVAITPRSPRYHATVKSSTPIPQPVSQEPSVNLRIANDTTQQTTGITGSSNGDSGTTNVFNPSRSVFLAGNSTLLEQLRSTVAPLLSSLGNKTPVFSGSYRNVNNANSPPRITPSGAPPRFSARYKGAELFVRKPSIYQATVPSITSSSTTPSIPVENSGSAPPIDVSNPGEPKFLTFYHALETASIRNEQLQGTSGSQQQEAVRDGQVDSNANAINGNGNNSNNDTTSPTVATASPQTPDTTVNTTQDSTLSLRLSEETENSTPAVTTADPGLENTSTTEQPSTSTEPASTTQRLSGTETISSTEQVTGGVDSVSTTEQIPTTTESVSMTEQTLNTESSSAQVAASTESITVMGDVSGNAESTTLAALVSVSMESVSTTEETTNSGNVEATTIGGSPNADISSRIGTGNYGVVPTTTVSGGLISSPPSITTTDASAVTNADIESSSVQSDGQSSTLSSNNVESADGSTTITSQIGETSTVSQTATTPEVVTVTAQSLNLGDTTTVSEVNSSPPNIDVSENPETNTIEQSETTSTQGTRLTDSPTTEAVSNNIVDTETTAPPITSTFRNRFIDFAQDILSRLQASITTTSVPIQDVATTVPSPTEMSNVIEDSAGNNTLENLAQIREGESTTSSSMDNASESTTMQIPQAVTTSQSGLMTAEQTTTPNAVGSITTPVSPTEINSLTSTQETNAEIELTTVTTQDTQTTSSTDSTAVADDRTPPSLLDVDLTSRITEMSDNSVQNPGNSSSPSLDIDTSAEPVTTSRYTTTTNDTLLTELMSIAKTLLSEEMEETEQLLPTQSTTDDTSAPEIDTINSDGSTDMDNLVGNDIETSSLSSEVLGTTQVAEMTSSPPDITTESIESTSVDLENTSENVESVVSSVDPTQNEVQSDVGSTTINLSLENPTTESNITPQSNLVDNEVEVIETTQATLFTLGSTSENLESTQSLENETLTSISDTTPMNSETTPDRTTQTPTTQSTDTTIASTTNFELTTNTYDLLSRNLIVSTETQTPLGQTTEMVTESTEESMLLTNSTTLMSTSVTESSTNRISEVTMPITVPETILSRVNIPETTPPESNTEDATMADGMELVGNLTSDVDVTTNTTTESATEVATNSLTIEPVNNESIEMTTSTITMAVDVNTLDVIVANQSSVTTTELTVDRTNLPTTTDVTNTLGEATTTNVPQTTLNLETETPTIVARFQDATTSTAQGTAGSANGQTTETNIPMSTESTMMPPPDESSPISTLSPSSDTGSTASSSAETTIATTTTTETATSTTTERLPDERTPISVTTTESPRADVFTVIAMSVTTMPTTDVDINENLVSTEVSADVSGTTTVSPENVNVISRTGEGDMAESTTPGATTTTAAATVTTTSTTTSTTTTTTTTTSTTTVTNPPTNATVASSTEGSSEMPTTARPMMPAVQTTPYLGRFGGSRLTPAPRFSLSSTTKAPLRDYLIYGIYPNKTIVRKRPEDNLIDARNVDSPYVIFGIFPDGRLVRKFPNGTIIPDPPRNPVEVVFSLSTTTTTNRPPPRIYYNQANQGTYNQYQAPAYYNNRRPVAELMTNFQRPGNVDLALTGNAIVGPNGGGPDFTGTLGTPGSVATTTTMSDASLNTRTGTSGNVVSGMAGPPTPIGSAARPPTDSQGGRIVQDREREEATRTKEAGGQRSSVYIGQDKFVNYWTDQASTSNPRVLNVRINSVATAVNEGPSSVASVPSFDNLLSNEPSGQVTAPPGFPWRDPLDQIFGITTSSPVITASVASNTLDDPADVNVPVMARPINPFVEVFTPVSSTIGSVQAIVTSTTPTAIGSVPITTPSSTTTTTTMAAATATTMAPTTTTTTTTMAPTTTTTTTTMAPTTTTTTTTTMAPTTTTMAPTTTTTMAPTTTTMQAAVTNAATQNTAAPQAPVTASNTADTRLPFGDGNGLLTSGQSQNAFGTTFDDLAFLNSLLQVPQSRATTPKTLTEVEQLLANKILSLALNNPAQNRAPKAVNVANGSPNTIVQTPTKPSSQPIVIDLFPSSTASSAVWEQAVTQQQTSQKPVESSSAHDQVTWKPVSTSVTKKEAVPSTTAKTTLISTTKGPVISAAKTTPRPKTTTQAPLGFAASLWQSLFGGSLFGQSTTQRPVKAVPKQVKNPPKSVSITPKPITTTQKPMESTQKIQAASEASSTSTPRIVDVAKVQVATVNSVGNENSVTTPQTTSTTKQPLLNNPNPRLPNVVTSTYSPEEDAKFVAALLKAFQADNTPSSSKRANGLTQDDEFLLRAILSGQGLPTTTSAPSTELNNAALLAALLKAQGIEPPTPPNNIREQLQSAQSLGQSVTSAPTASPTTGTTITTRPASTARPTVTTKTPVTPRPTSRPRPRTTTWSPSSTYPPPLFSSFANYGTAVQSPGGDNSGNGRLFGATRAFSQFLGAAITGAAQQLQSLVRNGTRMVSEVVG